MKKFDYLVGMRREHYLSCEKLPEYVEVERVFNENSNLRQEIENIGQNVEVTLKKYDEASVRENNSKICPGKGDIYIYVGSSKEMREIEAKLGPDFKGIPYRIQNV